MSNFKNLNAYRIAYQTAMEIFEKSKTFPREEKYSLTDQIRRSSRSVCANFAEAFRKIHYPKHFVSKLSDSDMENSETAVWLDFSLSCKYISEMEHAELMEKNVQVGRLIGDILKFPQKYMK